jgi:hypothetical protein
VAFRDQYQWEFGSPAQMVVLAGRANDSSLILMLCYLKATVRVKLCKECTIFCRGRWCCESDGVAG